MQDKEQNNMLNWQCKLDELDCIPNEAPLNKEALWDKLHDRMQKRSNAEKLRWYWIAAACILIISTITISTYKPQHSIIVQKNIHKDSAITNTIMKPAIINSLITKKTQNLKEIKQAIVLPKTINKAKPGNTNILVMDSEEVNILTERISVKKIPDSISIAIATAPPPKKLKMVHVNELNNFTNEESIIDKYQQKSFLHVAFNNRSATNNAEQNLAFPKNTIKIKLNL